MRRQQRVGTKYESGLDAQLDHNQMELVDELITPHVRLPEKLGGGKIVSSVPAYNHEAQPVQARGRIVWNRAYVFQPHGPSYIDPVPDPGLGGGH
jgi:hypothetical protein